MKRLKSIVLVCILSSVIGCQLANTDMVPIDNYVIEIIDESPEEVQINQGTVIESEEETDNSNEESANSFDWEQYKDSMDERQFSSLSKYISLFEEDKTVYYYQIEKECSLSDLKESFEIDNYTVQNFTLVDMNDDGEEELIANFDLGPGLTFVFTIIDEKYYGSFFSAREMRELQANGNFSASGGAADTYFCKLYISKEKMESVSFAEKHGWGEECNWTEQEYEDFMKENYSNPAKFWDLNIQID